LEFLKCISAFQVSLPIQALSLYITHTFRIRTLKKQHISRHKFTFLNLQNITNLYISPLSHNKPFSSPIIHLHLRLILLLIGPISLVIFKGILNHTQCNHKRQWQSHCREAIRDTYQRNCLQKGHK